MNTTRLHRIISILLLILFLYNILGYFVYVSLARYRIRKEIKTMIKRAVPENELAVIAMTREVEKNIRWFEGGKEFRYKGKMYDVVRTKQAGTVTYYYCVNDVQEERLFAGLDAHIDRCMADNADPRTHTQKQIKKLMHDFCTDFFKCSFILFHKQINTTRYSAALLSEDTEPVPHPPEFLGAI